ncbi:DUF167 domain-containing protein [Candidatus Woesearchaeota archaeon]|nr:DUF167 domain-containing protein [Candidatus Woesearchaeota archaeon]MCF7901198.1 DUF167 domain-containing protein [Candidatus Woesearchaeota archaeon]MCF8013707.1 DUF167 domain-containing protein [Candidatus Woesearchaeota archaeon]
MSKIDLFNEIKKKGTFMIDVKTNGNKTELKEFNKSKQAYLMDVSAPPQDNKANIEIIKYFSKNLKKDIRIMSGATSKKKLIRII